jgi:hypothetical protein
MLHTEVAQWWTMLPEHERQRVLEGIPGCREYGLVKTNLPAAGEAAVEKEWRGRYLNRVQFHLSGESEDSGRMDAYYLVNDVRTGGQP